MALLVEYAISLGIDQREGTWLIRYANPLADQSVESAYLPLDKTDKRIGTIVNGIPFVKPGDSLIQVCKWLTTRITKYPYYWPWEGKPVDRFGYDFVVTKNHAGAITDIDITELAFQIVKKQIEVVVPGTETEVVETTEVLEAGGTYVKMQVVLERPSPVSEITINPFAKYPLELVSIMYEEDIETYHPRKELLIEGKKPAASTSSMTIKFPAITAKRFTIILRQKNYLKNTYLVQQGDVEKRELWDKISQREGDVTLDMQDGLETVSGKEIAQYSGWNIYLDALRKYENQLEGWKQQLANYNFYKAKLQEKEQTDADYNRQMDQYRAEFYEAQNKWYKESLAWLKDKKDYDLSRGIKGKYDDALAFHSKRLRDMRSWNNTWG